MKQIFVRLGIALAIIMLCFQGINTPWAQEPLPGKFSKPTEKILDNTYGFGVFTHPVPAVQKWEEGISRKFFSQDCDKYGPRVRPNSGDCIDCRKMEEEIGLSGKEFDELRQYFDKNPNLESTKEVKAERGVDYDQWVWMNRAIRLQKEGMERVLPFLTSMHEDLRTINKGTGSSDLLELDGNMKSARQFANQVKSNLKRMALIEAAVTRGKLSKDEQEAYGKETDMIIRSTPVVAQSDLHTWVEQAAEQGNRAQSNRSAPNVETFIENFFNENTLNINKSMEIAVASHEKMISDKLPQLQALIADEAKLREAYKKSPAGDAKKSYDDFVTKILHSAPLLEAVTGTDPDKIPGYERAGCDLRARLSKLGTFKNSQLFAYSMALGFGGYGAAARGISMFPKLSALSRGGLVAASNIPSGVLDYSVGLNETAKQCEALGAQLVAGASTAQKGDAAFSKQYMECWQAENSAKNMTAGGYALGALTSFWTPSIQKLAKSATGEMLKLAKATESGVTAAEMPKLAEFTGAQLAELQVVAARRAEESFTKLDLPKIKARVAALEKNGKFTNKQASAEIEARTEEAYQKRLTKELDQEKKEYQKRLDSAVEACKPGGKAMSWADEIGMPWLTSSLDRSTPLHP